MLHGGSVIPEKINYVMIKKITIISGYVAFIVLQFLFFILSMFSCTTVDKLPAAGAHFSHDLDLDEVACDSFVYFSGAEIEIKGLYNEDSVRFWLKTADPRTTAGFLVNGLSFWIDPEASKNKDLGIIYPSASHTVIQKEIKRMRDTLENNNDTVNDEHFDISKLIESVKARRVVVQTVDGAGFATDKQAAIFLDNDKVLNYVVTLSFSALGIEGHEDLKLSVGVISEGAELPRQDSRDRHPGTTGPGGQRGYPPDRHYPQRDTRAQQERLKPVNVWIIFVFDGKEAEANGMRDEENPPHY